ncbi:doublecortin domain-containing protein 2 isoform X4 [Ascaphus truei]|uniref:doublecortin domain-containing protein 2 isoform X4 n=1 Tax=Ascaphus truei TaxID=8439 RepID=UPI003F594BB6
MQPAPVVGGGSRSLAPLSQQPAVKTVHVYRNGDPFYRSRRMLIHEKRVGTFEVFLKEVTGGVQAPFGAVRNLYTPRAGHRVTSLDDLQPGERYVAGGRETFKKLDYLHIGEIKKKPVENTIQVKPVSHSRINVSARFRKPIQEPRTVFLIANGDIINPVVRLLIPRKILDQWELVLAMVTEKVRIRSGAVHRLYTLEGIPIHDGSELENGQFYVAVGRDKFKKLPYGDLIFSKSSTRRTYGSKASSLPPINGFRKSKESRQERHTKSTGGSSDAVDNLMSPQPPKAKVMKDYMVNYTSQIPRKPIRVKQNNEQINSTFMFPESDDGVFKACEDRPEMWGASEVQEDENTKVEVPVDQRAAETVEEEERDNEGNECEEADEDGEAEDENDQNHVTQKHTHIDETSEAEDHSLVSNEVESNHGTMNSDSEDEGNNEEVEYEEEEPQIVNSVNKEGGDGMEQINGDISVKEEEDTDVNKDNQSQAEDSLPRPTSSRLLEKMSTPTESEKKEYVAVA